MSYVVTGATGQVGSAVVDYLVEKNLPVRVFIRSEEKAEGFRSRGIDVIVGGLTDVSSLIKAFQGAKAVFAMTPPGLNSENLLDDARHMSQALKEAFEQTSVPRVVVLSSMGAERSSGTGNILTAYILEQALKDSAKEVIFVRPCSFTENWIQPIQTVQVGQSTAILSMLQKLDQKLDHVATNDIGRVAAQFMTETNDLVQHNTIVELKGPEAISPNDVAKLVSESLGKDVAAMAMDETMIRTTFERIGWPKVTQDNWIEMAGGFDDNTICWTNDPNVIRITGTIKPIDVFQKVLR